VRKALHMLLLPMRKMQFSLYKLYTSFQIPRSLGQLTMYRSFRLSPILLLVRISGIKFAQPTRYPTLQTCKAQAAGRILTCTNFEMGCMFPKFSGILVSARAHQYSTKAPSSFRSLILNSRCSCHGRHPFRAP